MGAVISYLYGDSGQSGVVEDTPEAGSEDVDKQKGSDPSYTVIYPPHEQKEYLQQLEVEEAAKKLKELKHPQVMIAPVDWDNMTPLEKKKHTKKLRVKKYKKKKREEEKHGAMIRKRKELQPWIDSLSAKQRMNIKEVQWTVPDDEDLLKYLRGHQDELVQCPNKFCGIFFERLYVDNKKKAPLVLGEDGKPISEAALGNYLDNRFRCHECDTVFCVQCNAIPYHLGETCDQYNVRTAHPPCKVCKKPLPPPPDKASKPEIICHGDECIKMVYNLCPTQACCKHPCTGMKGVPCFCLKDSCIAAQKITQRGSDFCNICWTDELEAGTCIMLSCSHIFHRHCVEQKLKHKWTGARISFSYANCPLCQKPIENTGDYTINTLLLNTKELRNEVKMKAMHFLKAEGMLDDIKAPDHKHHGNPMEYALEVFSFYLCHTCKSPYYGGKRQCGDILNFNPEELVCGGCSGLLSCDKEKHGKKYVQYKCRFCCSVASWFCFGRVHYCEGCHNNPYQYWACNNVLSSVPPQCKGKEQCPLGIDHPPNGFEEMSLGCSRCKLEADGIGFDDDNEPEMEDDEDIFY